MPHQAFYACLNVPNNREQLEDHAKNYGWSNGRGSCAVNDFRLCSTISMQACCPLAYFGHYLTLADHRHNTGRFQ